MEIERWLPLYREIIVDLGYDESEDHRAGALLARLAKGHRTLDVDSFQTMLAGRATIVAKGPKLKEGLRMRDPSSPLISAGSATASVMDEGIIPEIVVSDLDGDVDAEIDASSNGTICLIHAHGDNIPALRKYVKEFEGPVIATMQPRPVPGTFNFGGLTDGDRAVEFARHFGARQIDLVGFDFSWFENDTPHRRKKIGWAGRIVCEMNPRDVILKRLGQNSIRI